VLVSRVARRQQALSRKIECPRTPATAQCPCTVRSSLNVLPIRLLQQLGIIMSRTVTSSRAQPEARAIGGEAGSRGPLYARLRRGTKPHRAGQYCAASKGISAVTAALPDMSSRRTCSESPAPAPRGRRLRLRPPPAYLRLPKAKRETPLSIFPNPDAIDLLSGGVSAAFNSNGTVTVVSRKVRIGQCHRARLAQIARRRNSNVGLTDGSHG